MDVGERRRRKKKEREEEVWRARGLD